VGVLEGVERLFAWLAGVKDGNEVQRHRGVVSWLKRDFGRKK